MNDPLQEDRVATQKLMRLIGMVARHRKMPGPITRKDIERERQRQVNELRRREGTSAVKL